MTILSISSESDIQKWMFQGKGEELDLIWWQYDSDGLDIHADRLVGFRKGECCGEISAYFISVESDRDDAIGTIFLSTEISNIAAFSKCETIEQCQEVARAIKNK